MSYCCLKNIEIHSYSIILLFTEFFPIQFFCLSKPFQVLFTSWLEEIERKQAEMVAAQVALEKLRQRDQTLKTENEMLKVHINTFVVL